MANKQGKHMGYLNDREATAFRRIEVARNRLHRLKDRRMRQIAQMALYRETMDLDRILRASKSLLPRYRGDFLKCSACGNAFNDEFSFLAHWRRESDGGCACESGAFMLLLLGFKTDEYRYPGEPRPQYVYRRPFWERDEG